MEIYNIHPDPALSNIVKVHPKCKKVMSIDGTNYYLYNRDHTWSYMYFVLYLKAMPVEEYIEKYCKKENNKGETIIIYDHRKALNKAKL
jgi:hypothetical protein